MGVWIRVKNNSYNSLLNLNSFCVNTNGDLIGWNGYCETDIAYLAKYSSEKEAEKVLDMIQDHIKNRVNEDMVFELPSSDEVEL